ncbi:hypothetical protein QVD17_22745 [Tagetes erecta]|uniref:Uncharacterized protein n=1 Tax=Tagetes erecta TaxID=13708 RepID=A0AAD8KGE5_TARER|nr:hypothetical protein QVD17_22745 [Tagetes erecta]
MDHGHNNGDQGGRVPSFANFAFPLSSPSWYTPTPQLAPPCNLSWDQSHQNLKTHDATFIPTNAFGEFSSSSLASGIASSVPIISSFNMDQRLGVDNMMINRPNIDFTNHVISYSSNQISDSGPNASRNCSKRLWTAEEDSKLYALVSQFGTKNWTLISESMDGRAGKQCRERWYNNLRPDIKSDVWSEDEERILIEAHEKMGNKWSQISKLLPGRTENAIKNHWNAATRKKTTRLNRNKKHEPDNNAMPKSTLLRDYMIKSMPTKKCTTSSNASMRDFTLDEPQPTSLSSDPDPTYDDDFSFMVQALEPHELQTNMNPQGFIGNGGDQHVLIEDDSFDMHLNSNFMSCPVTQPVYAYGDMNMDLAFSGDFSSA